MTASTLNLANTFGEFAAARGQPRELPPPAVSVVIPPPPPPLPPPLPLLPPAFAPPAGPPAGPPPQGPAPAPTPGVPPAPEPESNLRLAPLLGRLLVQGSRRRGTRLCPLR